MPSGKIISFSSCNSGTYTSDNTIDSPALQPLGHTLSHTQSHTHTHTHTQGNRGIIDPDLHVGSSKNYVTRLPFWWADDEFNQLLCAALIYSDLFLTLVGLVSGIK